MINQYAPYQAQYAYAPTPGKKAQEKTPQEKRSAAKGQGGLEGAMQADGSPSPFQSWSSTDVTALLGEYESSQAGYLPQYGVSAAVLGQPKVVELAIIDPTSFAPILGAYAPWQNTIYLLANPGTHDPLCVSTHEQNHAKVERQPGDKTYHQDERLIDEATARELGDNSVNRFSSDHYRI